MDWQVKLTIIFILLFLLFFSALFSGAETAYTSINPSKIEEDIMKGKKASKLIKKHYKNFGWTLSTILISNNAVNIGASSLATYFLAKLVVGGVSIPLISTAIVTPILVAFGEIFPKLLAKKYSYGYLKKVVYLMEILNWIFFPITYPISKITLHSKVTNTEKDLLNLVQLAKKEGVLDLHEATLAKKALDMDTKIVKNIMVKKQDILSIDIDAPVIEAKKLFESSGFSRLIVEKNKKKIGLLILKDIIFKNDFEKIKSYVKPIIFISKSQQISRALEKMRVRKTHLALAVERQGSSSVVGLITIEDIIEELVGEIYDEHDEDLAIREIAHFKWIAQGNVPMKMISQTIKFKFEEIDNISLKQWIQSRINRKIRKNLKYEFKDIILFKIIQNKNKEETLIEIVKKS